MANLSNLNNRFIVSDAGHVSIGNVTTNTYLVHAKSSAINNAILALESSSWQSGASAELRLSYVAGHERSIKGGYSTGLEFYTNNATPAISILPGGSASGATGNVGIGTTSPDAKLDVHAPSTTAPSLTMGAAAGQIFKNEDLEFAFGLNNASPYNGWMQTRFAGNASRSFSINPLGGNVGIGTNSPIEKLQVVGQLISTGSNSTSSTAGAERAIMDLSGYSATDHSARFGHFRGTNSVGAGQLRLYTDSVERLRINASGNVGIGREPFVSSLNNTVIDVSPVASLWGYSNSAYLNANAYYNSEWLYKTTATAGVFQIDGSELSFRQAASGTIDTPITFTQPFTIRPSGNVGIGTPLPGAQLHNYSTAATNVFITGYGTAAQNDWGAQNCMFVGTDNGLLISKANAANNTNRIFNFYNDANGHAQFYMHASAATAAVKIQASGNSYFNGGNVGIGTTGPATKLTVKGATQFGGNSTSTAALTSEFSAYGTTQNLYNITIQEGAVWSPGIAVINFAASRSGLQKHYAGQIIVRLTYYNQSGVAGQGGWAAPSVVAAVVAYSGQAETYIRVYVNGSNTGNPQTIQIGVRDIDDTTNYFVSDIRVTLRSGALTITS